MRTSLGHQIKEKLQKRHSIAATHHSDILDDNRVQLELDGFTCDVSLEDATSLKNQPPIQFSFTLYDVDGCGKITKDDIAGLISTIFENIGNTVEVPHLGKKTINVKLTVSPDSKHQQKTVPKDEVHENRVSKARKTQSAPRRRCQPNVLLSDDGVVEEGSESRSEIQAPLTKIQNKTSTIDKSMDRNLTIEKNNVYESINNLKYSNQTHAIKNLVSKKNMKNIEICKNCKPNYLSGGLPINENDEIDNRQHRLSSKKKVLRKSKSKRQRVRLYSN